MFVPTLVQFCFSLGRAYFTKLQGSMRDAVSGFGQGTFISLLNLVYLPHQTLLALDAIIRSLVRSFITGQRCSSGKPLPRRSRRVTAAPRSTATLP
jgi:cyclic beta-1,2-glucan synthetase